MKTLYKLTNELGDYFVIAESSTEAETKLLRVLDAGEGYGFSKKRKVKLITVVAEEITAQNSIGFPYDLCDKFLLT